MQNLEIEEIPSVFESNSLNLRFVSSDLIHGLKIYEGEQGYISIQHQMSWTTTF